MKSEELKYWSAFPALLGGACIGLLILLTLRSFYYGAMNYSSHMAPQIVYFFSPVLLIFIMALSLPIEFLFRYWHIPTSRYQAILIGVGYSTILTWWAFPGHWQIFIVLNPIFIRWIIGLMDHNK